jgi:HEAT repeat protein
MTELRNIPVDDAVHLLEQLAAEPRRGYRCRALIGMPSISRTRAERLAVALVTDPEEVVRSYACETLGQLKDRRSLLLMAQLLGSDPSSLVRHTAAFWLGELGDESVLPALLSAVELDSGPDHEGRPVREIAAKAVQKIRSRLAARRASGVERERDSN